jgi:hypothetical protein
VQANDGYLLQDYPVEEKNIILICIHKFSEMSFTFHTFADILLAESPKVIF